MQALSKALVWKNTWKIHGLDSCSPLSAFWSPVEIRAKRWLMGTRCSWPPWLLGWPTGWRRRTIGWRSACTAGRPYHPRHRCQDPPYPTRCLTGAAHNKTGFVKTDLKINALLFTEQRGVGLRNFRKYQNKRFQQTCYQTVTIRQLCVVTPVQVFLITALDDY